MKNEKEYETSFSMSRNLFLLPRAFDPRKKTSHSERRSKLFAACRETNHSAMGVILAIVFLATSITG